MTVTISGTNGIDKVQDGTIQSADFAAGIPSVSDLPAGTVLQVVNATTSTTLSTTSTTYTDTNLTATITPTSATSKILVFVSQEGVLSRSADSAYGGLQLVRNSTVILKSVESSSGPYDIGILAGNSYGVGTYYRWAVNYLDSPATTSAVTYKTQARTYDGNQTITCQITGAVTNGTSIITLMEIAA